jgi:MFS family permease
MAGQVADRTGRRDRVIHLGIGVATVSMLLWSQQPGWAVPLSLLFGLVGAAPAGVIMSLTGEAMSPERRAFGMGVFLSLYFVLVTLAPPAAGWLFDRTGDASVPLVFGAALFAATSVATWVFRRLHRSGSGAARIGPR